MKKTKNFNDFLIDLMLEGVNKKGHGVNELPFILGPKFKNLLMSLTHPIAKKLLEIDDKKVDKKVTFVELHKTEKNKVTLVNSNKAYDNIIQDQPNVELDKIKVSLALDSIDTLHSAFVLTSNWWTKNRVDVKLGSFIGKVFPKEYKQGGDPGQDIESFVQGVIAARTLKIDRFKIVSGDDIVKYYDEDMYDVRNADDNTPVHGSPLASSCMRHDYCGDYIKFYAKNPDVKLLILFSDIEEHADKIIGRALLWDLNIPSGRTFMDRIYYRYEKDMAMFKQYAEEQGWLYKSTQNMHSTTKIVDSKTGNIERMNLETKHTFKANEWYPYMDTMKWFNREDEYLTNTEIEDSEVYFLEDISGGYEYVSDERIYVEFYDESIDPDDLTYCELGGEDRKHDDAIYIESKDMYATQEYVDDHLSWSEYENNYFDNDDVTYSDYHNDYILNDDAIDMHKWADEDDFKEIAETEEVRHLDEIDHTILPYQRNGEWYHFDMDDYKEYFVQVRLAAGQPSHGWKHKVWDKDKLFKWNNGWHYEYNATMKNKLTGQKRLWDD